MSKSNNANIIKTVNSYLEEKNYTKTEITTSPSNEGFDVTVVINEHTLTFGMQDENDSSMNKIIDEFTRDIPTDQIK